MKKIILVSVLVALLAVLLCSCAGTAQAPVVEAEDSDCVTISLEENPTTGYQWSYTVDPEGVLEEKSSEYIEGNSDGEMTGVPGKHEWVFEAVSDGDVNITFVYARSFEPDEEPADSVTYTYNVTDGVVVLVNQQ